MTAAKQSVHLRVAADGCLEDISRVHLLLLEKVSKGHAVGALPNRLADITQALALLTRWL